jgi:mono/diheme cytochrome c family protein
MPRGSFRSIAAAAIIASTAATAHAADPQIERGKYLVAIAGCGDCHTQGHFLGHPDQAQLLGGSDVGFGVPGKGVFVGPNLTPDNETGLGKWTEVQIVTAITTGTRPDGRVLAPQMPWRELANLTKEDAAAIAAYLKSLPPVSHKVPGPLPPDQPIPVLVMTILPGPVFSSLPPPPK